MNGRLLDTNAAIAIIENEPSMQKWLDDDYETLLPSPAVGELYYGAYKSGRVEANLKRVNEFVAGNVILGTNEATAQLYGQIKNELKIKGRPIPENDIWIAAIARQYNLTLVTRDQHFKDVSNLHTESW